MLKPLEKSEFDACADFAYELSLDLTRSGYPTYCDGFKTRQDFIDNVQKTFSRPDKKGLLFIRDGQTEGLIAFDCPEEDRYLHPYIFSIRQDTAAALMEFIAYCRERWPGFTLDLGFPAENVEALTWLEREGAPCIEQSWNYGYFLDQYTPLPEPSGVKRVTAENFADFAAIHRRIEGDMYWNCDRVRESLDQWVIFVAGEGNSAGEVLMTMDEDPHQEIFALEFADGVYREGPFRALLTVSLNTLKEKGAKYLTFFVDVGQPEGEVLNAMGFQLVDVCVIYRLKL